MSEHGIQHDPPLQTEHNRMKWCISTILKRVGIGRRRYDLTQAEMQRGPDWDRQMEICADRKRRARSPDLPRLPRPPTD